MSLAVKRFNVVKNKSRFNEDIIHIFVIIIYLIINLIVIIILETLLTSLKLINHPYLSKHTIVNCKSHITIQNKQTDKFENYFPQTYKDFNYGNIKSCDLTNNTTTTISYNNINCVVLIFIVNYYFYIYYK